jgi:hypothetical protein
VSVVGEPWRLLRDPPSTGAPANQPRSADETDARRRSLIVCRACGTRLSQSDATFSPDDGPCRRVFANPAGRVFEVLTVKIAEGKLSGVPTHEHSWFGGFSWSYFACGGCGRHVGWGFHSPSEPFHARFFALMTSEIREQDGQV